MEKQKIRILFYTNDSAGVKYFRIQTPATQLDTDFSEDFHIEINSEINFNDPKTFEYLKSFNIIHYHRQLLPDTKQMLALVTELRKTGTKFIMDIDDFWELSMEHPHYQISKEKKLHLPIIENLKIADYVTTTTEAFANEIKKITGKDNVIVLYNSVNPLTMKQFQNNWKPDPDGRVRIAYAGGSSHMGDIQQLEGVFNMLAADPELRYKFKIILVGWDQNGHTTEVSFNQSFEKELQARGLWTNDMVKAINKSRGNIDMIPNIPDDLKNSFRNNVFLSKERAIKSEESVYLAYEKILTDNHKIIEDKEYVNWLMHFEKNEKYPNEGIYSRIWTQKANVYAAALDQADIVLAPLAENKFNQMKSNLKQVECWTRKLPIVCSDMIPYNVEGKHMENCILIPTKKNAKKYWAKYLKRLILNKDLREKLGNELYEDFKDEYNLVNVTKKRAEFYKKIINNE